MNKNNQTKARKKYSILNEQELKKKKEKKMNEWMKQYSGSAHSNKLGRTKRLDILQICWNAFNF